MLVRTKDKLALVSQSEYHTFKTSRDCIFCNPPERKIFYETQNFYLTYDSSPLVEGHILLHTKKHIGCIGEIDAEIFDEFIELKNKIKCILLEIYGSVIFFEHGRAGHCGVILNDPNCHHFHLHALPLDLNIIEKVSEKFDGISFTDLNEISELYNRYGPYLYCENYLGKKCFYPIVVDLESHYLRTVIANNIGHENRADYEEYSNLNFINSFIKKAMKYESRIF